MEAPRQDSRDASQRQQENERMMHMYLVVAVALAFTPGGPVATHALLAGLGALVDLARLLLQRFLMGSAQLAAV